MKARPTVDSIAPDVVGNHPPIWQADAGRSRAFVISKTPHVVLVVLVGSLDKLAGYRLSEALNETFGAARTPFHSFWDLDALEHYDSVVRVRCTEALRRHRARLTSIQSFSRSRLVNMGVSVANLALGGIITQHKTRENLLQALNDACAAPPSET